VLTGCIEDAETTKQSDPMRDEDIPSTHSKINRKQNQTKCLFKFPFQRRARSLSLPKDEDGNEIQLPEDT